MRYPYRSRAITDLGNYVPQGNHISIFWHDGAVLHSSSTTFTLQYVLFTWYSASPGSYRARPPGSRDRRFGLCNFVLQWAAADNLTLFISRGDGVAMQMHPGEVCIPSQLASARVGGTSQPSNHLLRTVAKSPIQALGAACFTHWRFDVRQESGAAIAGVCRVYSQSPAGYFSAF